MPEPRFRPVAVLAGCAAFLLAAPTQARAQETGEITGQVVSASSQAPLAEVQVFVVGAGIGTSTNSAGRFLLSNVPAGTVTVQVTIVGHGSAEQTLQLTAGETAVASFELLESAIGLDEIVVTGVPGGTRRRAIGNAVGNVDAATIAQAAPVADVQQVLRGRVPSVNMVGGGMVGQAPRIRVRGASTISLAGNPLIYIDGVRANRAEATGYTYGNNAGVRSMLSSLDPEQIERIEVLKGPAAATLYGTEASRGVINVITKRGRAGGAKVDMLIRQGTNFMLDPMDKPGFTNYWRDESTGEVHSLNMMQHLKDQGIDIFDYGHVQTYGATLSGGSEDTQYFFSGTYSDETGVLSYNWAQKLNLRGNIDTQLSEDLGVSLNLGYTNSEDRLPRDGFGSVMEGIEFGNPRQLQENRCRTDPGFGCDLLNGFLSFDHPLRDRTLVNNQLLDRFTGGVTLDYRPFGWLTARLITGLDFTSQLDVAFREFQANDTALVVLGPVGATGFRNERRRSYFLTTTDLSTTANLNLTSKLASATSVGVQYYTNSTGFLSGRGQQFAGPGLSTITSTSVVDVPLNNRVENNTFGTYVQETLTWQDRLFLTGAVRVDNNSAFGDDIEFVTYPKASLSWVLNEESWFEDVAPSWLNALRLRVAWGQSGEQPEAFSALRTFSPVTGPQNTAGVTPNTVGNPDLTAEVGEETEVGFDSDLFGSRLGLQFTYYHKLTKDAILSRDLPPSGGFTGQQFVNAGRIMNQGAEAQLNALLIDRPGLRWDVGFNLSYNDAEVQQLSGEPGDTTIVFNSWSSMEHRVGHPPFSWFGVDVVSAELDPQTGRAINAMCSDGAGGVTPCFDEEGNTIAPRVFLARAIAPWEMSLSTAVALGESLRFHALFTSELGHKRFDNTLRQRCRLYEVCRANAFPEEWDPIMRATAQSNDQIIDSWVNDVGFVRLKEVSVSYDLPDRLIQSFGMSRATWQIAGRNLLTFTDWTATDPEVIFSSGGRAFMQQNNLPLPNQIVTTLRFSF